MEMANALYFGAGALLMAFVWGWLHNLRVQAERMVRQSKTSHAFKDKLKEQLADAVLKRHKVRTELLQCEHEEAHLDEFIAFLREEIEGLDREINEASKRTRPPGWAPKVGAVNLASESLESVEKAVEELGQMPMTPGIVHGYQPILRPDDASEPPKAP